MCVGAKSEPLVSLRRNTRCHERLTSKLHLPLGLADRIPQRDATGDDVVRIVGGGNPHGDLRSADA